MAARLDVRVFDQKETADEGRTVCMLIPAGFTTLFPYVVAEKARAYLDFMANAFGAEIMGIHASPDGVVINAHVRFGDTTIMVSDSRGQRQPTQGQFYLYVEDAHTSMARALAAGCTQKSPVRDQPFGDRQGGASDPWGNSWWLSQRLIEGPYGTGMASSQNTGREG
jgi:PhnB protein